MEKINSVSTVEQFNKDYVEYADYVQKHRVTPEFRDGLKPVQRRIIYAAYAYNHATDLMKSANIIGTTMAHLHPHGDSSIEGALYTMANWYQTKQPLFNGRGNLGNTFQNVPAAPRYTECALNKFTIDCVLGELIKNRDVVDWEENYDRKSKEPMYLPAKLPLLLINGSTGIGVGMKVDIPSHNINEVIDATIALIQNPEMKQLALIPDHCQKCEIIDTDWFDICNKGVGNYKVRGVVEISQYSGHNKKYNGFPTLIIKSCPNLTFLDSIVEQIDKMVKENKIIGIIDIEDQSTVNDMNYVLILKPGTDPNFIRSALYKNTRLQQTFRVNFLVLDNMSRENKVMRFSYIGYLKSWIEFRKITKLRYYENELQKIMTEVHKLESYIWAIQSGKADEAIKIIKKQKQIDDNATVEALIKKCNITDLQAKFFMNCEIKKLSQGYLNQFISEYNTLNAQAQEYRDAVLIDGRLEQIIVQELLDIKNKYGVPRTCRVIRESEANGVIEGDFKIVITENNFIRKIGVEDNIAVKNNDNIKFVTVMDNSKNLILFDNIGRVYKIPVSKIPFTDKNSNGVDIRIINKYINAPLISIYPEPVIEDYKDIGYLVTLTRAGYIKKMPLTDFLAVPPSGIVYSKVDENDSIIYTALFSDDNDIIIYSYNKALRISIHEVPLLKRNARGNVSMTCEHVDGLSLINNNTTDILVITAKGYINKLVPDCIKSGRTKKGSNVIKLSKDDYIVSILGVNASNIVRCITMNGDVYDIKTSDIPAGSSISTGKKIISTKSGVVASVNLM